MADLTTNFAGIRCPNPFWLASAPPTNCGDQVMRAFDAGWGGAVWKTLGEPIVNVSSRYSSVDWNGQRMMGLNNIELITDRPLEVNLREITRGQEALPEARGDRVADGGVEARGLARHRQALRGRRRRRPRAEFRLPARHERARHGLGRRPGARVRLHDHRVGEGSRAHAGDRQADAEHHRHPHGRRARRKRGGADAVSPSTPSTRSPASTSTRSRRGPMSAGTRRTAAIAGRR